MFRRTTHLLLLLALAAVAGCASAPSSSSQSPAAPGGVTYRDDERLQKVWLADGFQFRGYDTLYLAETAADVPKLNPDGVESLTWARAVVRDELAAALEARGLFASVVTKEADVKPGSKVLRLESTIIDYEKGGGGARWFAGLYGAGQPVVKVRGRMTDGGRAVFLFETRRSGESGKARWLGGYLSDRDIQTEDIRDLGKALAEFIAQRSR
ncbi:MAG: DUF4410 domain-containing protein [Candidatus Rokubacteria bacterium]|nr:DUF4410 domain-containing protein [Candidatus Rokubacteria bacterium]